jgi:hypothetical protein
MTPWERIAAQDLVMTRWLALDPFVRHRRLARERERQSVTPVVLAQPVPSGITVQRRGRVTERLLTHRGQTHTVPEWAGLIGVDRSTLYHRLQLAWPLERALTLRVSPERRCVA